MNRRVRLPVCVNQWLSSVQLSCIPHGNPGNITQLWSLIANVVLRMTQDERDGLSCCEQQAARRFVPGGASDAGIDATTLTAIVADPGRLLKYPA